VIYTEQQIEGKQDGDGTHPYPMPGDLAQIKNSHDVLIKDGSYGVIEGIIGERRDEYLVCFNAYSTFRESSVSSSGGPAYMIKAKDLVDAKKSIEWYFWKWRDRPRAGGGLPYKENCRVWLFDAKTKRAAAE
jgi:hypothetical protein